MNHVNIFKGWPLQDAPSKLVQLWYKSFPPGRFLPGGNEEANLMNSVPHDLVRRIRFFWIFNDKILGTGFSRYVLNDK